jgi:hypothetical protein
LRGTIARSTASNFGGGVGSGAKFKNARTRRE